MKQLLIVVDMQNDFIDGALGTPEAQAIVPGVVSRVKECLDAGTEVVFTRDTHFPDYLNTMEGRKLPVPHCIKGTEGWQICSQLAGYAERCFDKITFGSQQLTEYVARGGYDQIELVGLCTDICVISNAMLIKAAVPEAVIQVRQDCCAGVTPQSHDNALNAMKMCHIDIV